MGRKFIRSKPANDAFRKGFDRLKKRRGSKVCQDCHHFPCWCKVSFGSAKSEGGTAARGGRARLHELMMRRPEKTPFHLLPKGVRRAANVLKIAESPKERDMLRSNLLNLTGDQVLCNRNEVEAGLREVQARRGW